MRFSYVNIPGDPSFLSPGFPAETGTVDIQGGKLFNGPIYTGPSADHILFDQIYLDGRGYPNGSGPHAMAYLNGSNIALTNSYAVSDDLYWLGAQDRILGSTILGAYYGTTLTTSGVLGMLVDNNYLQGCGIVHHFDDEWAPLMPNQDITYTRNTLYRDLKCAYGSTQNLAAYPEGVYGPTRHHLECKICNRVLISGNTFTNSWRTVNSGAAIALTPREDSSAGIPSVVTVSSNVLTYIYPPASVVGSGLSSSDWVDCDDGMIHQVISNSPSSPSFTIASSPGISNGTHYCRSVTFNGGVDNLTISGNTISNVTNAYNTFGWEYLNLPMVFPSPLQYWTAGNNLYNGIIDDGFHQDPGVTQGSGGGYVYEQMSYSMGDVSSQHETMYNIVGGSAGYTGLFGNYSTIWGGGQFGSTLSQNSEGMLLNNNIGSMGPTPSTCSPPCNANSPVSDTGTGQSGTAEMTFLYTTANGPSVIGNNLYQMPVAPPHTYPATVKWLSNPSQQLFFDAGAQQLPLVRMISLGVMFPAV